MKRAIVSMATVLLLLSSAAAVQNLITFWNVGITAARASTAPGSATVSGMGIYLGCKC